MGELISALLDGELSAEEAERVRQHLDGCAECRAMYADFAAMHEAMQEEISLPAGLHDKIMGGIAKAAEAQKKRRRLRVLRTALPTAACLVLVAGALFAGSHGLRAAGAGTAVNTSAAVTAGGAAPSMFSASKGIMPMNDALEEAALCAEPAADAGECYAESNEAAFDGAYANSAANEAAVVSARLDPDGSGTLRSVEDAQALAALLSPVPMPEPTKIGDAEQVGAAELEYADGTVRTLRLQIRDGQIWVEEQDMVYLASGTAEELAALR